MDRIRVREFGRHLRDGEIEGRETDVMKLARTRVRGDLAKSIVQDRGSPTKRKADLRIPASKNFRPRTIDGRTSFHFSHEAVSKTRNNIQKDSGLKIGPGAARKHGKYIERDGAIVKMTEKEEAELQKMLEAHPELEAGESTDGVLTIERRKQAALHGYYLERQEALATQPDGEKVLFTNISGDAEERARVWDKIEEFERNPSQDELILHVARHREFWDRVAKDPELPEPLADALRIADPERPYRFQTDDARSSLRWLREQPDWDKENPAITSKLGEGGRIQYRIIGELPHELDLRGRTAILAEFAHEFEKRKLPYVAVMHAPDHTNDDRNWHFHLIYYDRPISKMADGRWDFEAEETFKRPNRMTRTNFPHRQEKLKEVNEKKWIPTMRKRLAEITNDHMQMAGLSRRVDARRYDEMGIHREAQEHLGTRAAALESMGVATPAGYSNANKEWDAVFEDVGRRREADQKKTDIQARRFHDRVDRGFGSDPNEGKALHARIERWRQDRDEAAEYTSFSVSVEKNYERLISRAEKVNKVCDRQIEAAKRLSAPLSRKIDSVRLTKRQTEALKEINEATAFMGPMLDEAKEWAKRSDLLRARAAREEKEIERILATSTDDVAGRVKDLKERRRNDEGVFRGQDGEYRRSLNKIEMDAWVESILKDRRRLVRRDRRVEPMEARPGDEKYLEAGNYGVMTPRLSKIKDSQDRLVADVVAYVARNPHAVQRTRNEQGDVVLSLRVSRPQWKSAFEDYAEDPDIRKAATDALATNDAARNGRTAEAGRTTTPQPAAAAGSDRTPAAAETGADMLLTRLSREPVRLRLVEGAITADAMALKELGATPKDLEPAFVQNRLRGIHREQVRDFARLAAFVEKHPYAIVEKDGRFRLGPKSPRELSAIATKWVADEEVQAGMKAVREALRGPARTAPGRKVEETRPQVGTETAPAPQPVRTEPTPPERPVEPPVRQPAAAQETPRPAGDQTPSPVPVPASGTQAPTRVPTPTERPETPRPVETPKEVATRDPAGPAPAPSQPSLFEDDGAASPATGQATFDRERPQMEPLRRQHAAVDQWMKAGEQERSLADRRRLAAELSRDRDALAAVVATDPELARQLQIDADAHRRAQSVANKRGRGRAPRR